jgi:hypothetical protein
MSPIGASRMVAPEAPLPTPKIATKDTSKQNFLNITHSFLGSQPKWGLSAQQLELFD